MGREGNPLQDGCAPPEASSLSRRMPNLTVCSCMPMGPEERFIMSASCSEEIPRLADVGLEVDWLLFLPRWLALALDTYRP